MTATATRNPRIKRIPQNVWAGRGAKRFDNRKDWLRMYAGMGGATFLGTVPVFLLMLWTDFESWPFAVLLAFLQQVIEFAIALYFVLSFSVVVGENGIESSMFGCVTHRLTWDKIARIETYRFFEMQGVRVYQPGKRRSQTLPVYFDQTEAVFREVGEWFGYASIAVPEETRTMPEQMAECQHTVVAAEPNTPEALWLQRRA